MVNVKSAFGIFALLYAAGAVAGIAWRSARPLAAAATARKPELLLINIATEQVAPLKAFLAEHHIVPESFYPVVRARLTAINDKPTEGNEDEALNRELNLTAKYAARS